MVQQQDAQCVGVCDLDGTWHPVDVCAGVCVHQMKKEGKRKFNLCYIW